MAELIVALDEPSFDRALAVVEQTSPRVQWYKVGYEAFYAYGETLLTTLRDAGKSIFLDLKLHDIPNTVAAAIRALARTRAAMVTVHASGGRAMLEAAVGARNEAAPGMRIIAVTALTSLSDKDLLLDGIERTTRDLVVVRARLAASAGVDGVVCGVAEAASVRATTWPEFTIVCPGIRPHGAKAADQHRVATPAEASKAGADFIVVGRPITQAADPAKVAREVLLELRTGA